MTGSDIQNVSHKTNHSSPTDNHASSSNSATLEAPVAEATVATLDGNTRPLTNVDGASGEVSTDEAKPSLEANNASADGVIQDTEENISTDADVASEIDQRRAKQLLDRAILLSERGDLAGAILASRQAVALAPDEPSGHSMLGLLHERAGDLEKAISAYEKVLQLSPNSTLERDSLDRLKATLESENSSVVFHFDDNDLFEEPAAIAPSLAGVVENPAEKTVAPSAAVTADMIGSPTSTTTAANATSAATTAKPVTNSGMVGASAAARAVASPAPTSSAPNSSTAKSDNDLSQLLGATSKAPLRPSLSYLNVPATAQKPSFALLMRRPSFYFKGAPIVAATTLGLLFMAWAEGISQNRYLQENVPGTPASQQIDIVPQPVPPASTTTTQEVPLGNSSNPAVPAPQNAVGNGGGIFGNGKATSPSTPTTSVAAPSAPAGRAAGGTVASGSSSAQTSSGVTSLPPAPINNPVIPQPGGVIGGSSGNGGGSAVNSGTLNSLPVMRPRNTATEVVRPSAPSASAGAATGGNADNGAGAAGSSAQGGMFNPANTPRGYIRIDPVRPANPAAPVARPANEARAAENAASRAASSGRANDVVSNLNRSIERQATGYTYQRRAMAFMEQGDYSRAADDFQSAIAAYQDQIRQNQNVEDARNGIQTSRSGLNLALSRITR